MKTIKLSMAIVLMAISAFAGLAQAAPVIYTLRTVADGQLGTFAFYEARVTIQMKGDTETVRTEKTATGGVVYINREGRATVTVSDGYQTAVAHFGRGEIFVRYDTEAGVVGFGSAVSPTYPIALGCANVANVGTYTRDCLQGTASLTGEASSASTPSQASGIVNALADPTATPYLSRATIALPASLSKNTLLTGMAHTCPGPYTTNSYPYGLNVLEILNCPTVADLQTDRGPFHLQDSVGFSNTATIDGFADDFSVDHFANVGALQVEVLEEEEE